MTLPPRHLSPIALVAAAALAAWLAAPAPVRPKPGAASQEAWEAPKIQPREAGQWTAAINKQKLWGESAEAEAAGRNPAAASAANAANAKPAKAEWSFAGVVIQGDTAFALISIGKDPSKPYRVGDKTPDGAQILRIEEDRLHLSTDGKASIVEIYRK